MKIYTRVGDQGMTKQVSGKMVSKTDAQIVTLGDIDEFQSYLGVVVASLGAPDLVAELSEVQRKLYQLEADISVKRHQEITLADTTALEERVDFFMETRLSCGSSSYPVVPRLVPGSSMLVRWRGVPNGRPWR